MTMPFTTATTSEFGSAWQDCLDDSDGTRCLVGCRPVGDVSALLVGLDATVRVHLSEAPFPDARIDITVRDGRVSISPGLDGTADLEIGATWHVATAWLGDDSALFGDCEWRVLRMDAPEQLAWLSVIEGALWLSGVCRV